MHHAGGLKAAAKRTAFGEVTNTANNIRPSKDDSTIPNKAGYETIDNSALLQENKKPAALLKPAQRPLTISGLRGLLANASNASNASHAPLAAKPSIDAIQPAPQPANIRKAITKKNTAVFKDTSAVDIAQNLIKQQETNAPASTVSLNIPAIQEQSQSEQHVVPAQSKVRRTQSKQAIDSTEEKVEIEDGHVPTHTGDGHGVYLDVDRCVQFSHYSAEDPQEQKQAAHHDDVVQLNQEANNAPNDDVPAAKDVRKHDSRPVSEPEEYWDEEEDEENYLEDGYITAQSYRSRGDNTTGGVTTLVVPKMNQKIKRELAAATQLVEASRTVEEIEDESWDTTMVAEYGDEIFQYMRELEVRPATVSSSLSVLTLDRARCHQTHTTWKTKLKSNGPCEPSSWIGLFKFTTDSTSCLKLSFSAPTTLTVSCLARSFHWESSNLSVPLRSSSLLSMKRSTARQFRRLFTWSMAATRSMRSSRPNASCLACSSSSSDGPVQ